MTSAGTQVAALALSSCSGGSAPSDVMATAVDRTGGDAVLQENYRREILKLRDLLNVFSIKFAYWKSWMGAGLKDKIRKIAADAINLSDDQLPALLTLQESRLYSLTQMSAYAFFLTSQSCDPGYGTDAYADLEEITNTQLRTVCLLKQLLQPRLTNDVIHSFVIQHYTKQVITLADQTPTVKRAFTATVMDLINETIGSGSYFIRSLDVS
ncbi:uncharacterized protein LOC131936798 [Physella acuta]|uniref:uncharacterized protein LOC131936798 n=1 Tax=Physella acuta TaxID=109671 RepID=UPI0027DB3F50|nr:uncharacterized protein LOC131936798 [Physella acuta]